MIIHLKHNGSSNNMKYSRILLPLFLYNSALYNGYQQFPAKLLFYENIILENISISN